MHLRKFTNHDINLLISWVTSPELLFQFAGHSWQFPLDDEELSVYFSFNKDRQAYIMEDEGFQGIGFGEIIYDDNPSPRLGRLIIGASEKRGQGYGSEMVRLMVEECVKCYNPEIVHLFVLENNEPAIRCYLKCGFEMQPDTFIHFGDDIREKAVLMTLTLTTNRSE